MEKTIKWLALAALWGCAPVSDDELTWDEEMDGEVLEDEDAEAVEVEGTEQALGSSSIVIGSRSIVIGSRTNDSSIVIGSRSNDSSIVIGSRTADTDSRGIVIGSRSATSEAELSEQDE